MVAGILAELGCWTGRTRAGDSYNLKGYFENLPLKQMLKQTYGFSLMGAFPTTQIGWRQSVRREIRSQGYQDGPWLFKTGAHYAGVWDEFDPIVVRITRKREKIIESYARYGGIWSSYGPEAAVQIIDRSLARLWSMPGIEIDTDQLVMGDDTQIRKVCKAASLPYRETGFIVPEAFHAG